MQTEKKLEQTVRCALEEMFQRKDSAVLAYELMAKCRNPQHRFFGSSAQHLEDLGLLQDDGSLHEETKRWVLKLLKGDGLSWELVDPE